jgi:hypothetical protein
MDCTAGRSRARPLHVVWAKLCVSQESEHEIHKFFLDHIGLVQHNLKSGLHVTVYHARRLLLGLSNFEKKYTSKTILRTSDLWLWRQAAKIQGRMWILQPTQSG